MWPCPSRSSRTAERSYRGHVSDEVELPPEGYGRYDDVEVHYNRSPPYPSPSPQSHHGHHGQRSSNRTYIDEHHRHYRHPQHHEQQQQHQHQQHRRQYNNHNGSTFSEASCSSAESAIIVVDREDYRLECRDDRQLVAESRKRNVQWSKPVDHHRHHKALINRSHMTPVSHGSHMTHMTQADSDPEYMVTSPARPSDVLLESATIGSSLKVEEGEVLTPASGKPKVEEELCTICGDRASGYHYNALSCEGCKGFFRRSITRAAHYVCKYGGNCEMDMWMRRKCQACRLKQCRTVGMKEECLLSERQCVARNARRQRVFKPRIPRHRLGTTSAKSELLSSVLSSADPVTPGVTSGSVSSISTGPSADRLSPHCRSPLDQLSDDHRELVTRIIGYQDKYELPTPEDVERISTLNIASTFAKASPSDAVFGHMVEMTILVTRLVVEFAKHLPGFHSLCKEDQIVLLKGSASEVMMLRTARRFDPETNTVVFGDGQPFTQNCMAFGGLQGFVDSMFEFSRGMASLTVDNAEYALLTALCIFSDRPGLRDLHIVGNIQEVYSNVLLSYVGHRRLYGSHYLAKLLMKLVELRTLSNEHSQCLYRLTVEKGSLPPLLSEYFDIPAPGINP